MLKSVFIARKTDGLLFCEVTPEDSADEILRRLKNKAFDFFKNIKNIKKKDDTSRINIENQNYVFDYKIKDNIVYLLIADSRVPYKLSESFLEELHEGFLEVSK